MAIFRKKRVIRKKRILKNKTSKPKVSLSVKRYVKKAIHANVENKCVQIQGGNSFGNVNESPDFNAYPMCPLSGFWNIGQGVTQGTRIGNQIKPVKVFLNYVLRPTAYDATFNPVCRPTEVQLFLGYVKSLPTLIPGGADVAQLFQAGAAVAAPVGNLRDIISIINSDYWVMKKRWTHKIGFADNAGTGGNAGVQFGSNNDFKLNVVKRLNITKHIPAMIQFNDAGLTPTSRNLFFMYYAVAADGTTFGTTILPTAIDFWVDFHYEDA